MEVDSSEVFHATQFEPLPVTSEAVARETRRDPVLARVYQSIVKGWCARVGGDKPYYERRNELTVHQGCILWGMREEKKRINALENESTNCSIYSKSQLILRNPGFQLCVNKSIKLALHAVLFGKHEERLAGQLISQKQIM